MEPIRYESPACWIEYNPTAIAGELAEALGAILSLRTVPYQRDWVEALQEIELKREIAGTSRIEGADFTDRELEAAMKETAHQLMTRSQRQAHAALKAYRWIATIPDDKPVDESMIKEIHRLIVTGADDDHCQPGELRRLDDNRVFGQPRHRGVNGGPECEVAFESFIQAVQRQYRDHHLIIQGLAAHYHLGAMHPFGDGNGRTARAIEALFLQRGGLRDTCFVAVSNYYYDEKAAYLKALADVRAANHDLTAFLAFGLRGIAQQSRRMLAEIQVQIQKVLFRNLMHDLFARLESPRKRVLATRQVAILELLLENDPRNLNEIRRLTMQRYKKLKNPAPAFIRDARALLWLKAIKAEKTAEGEFSIRLNLSWPTEITDTGFFAAIQQMPKAKSPEYLQ